MLFNSYLFMLLLPLLFLTNCFAFQFFQKFTVLNQKLRRPTFHTHTHSLSLSLSDRSFPILLSLSLCESDFFSFLCLIRNSKFFFCNFSNSIFLSLFAYKAHIIHALSSAQYPRDQYSGFKERLRLNNVSARGYFCSLIMYLDEFCK